MQVGENVHLLTEIGYDHKLKGLTGFNKKDVLVLVAKHWEGSEKVQHSNDILAGFRTPASVA